MAADGVRRLLHPQSVTPRPTQDASHLALALCVYLFPLVLGYALLLLFECVEQQHD